METDRIESEPAAGFAAAVLDSLVDCIVVLDLDGVIVWANEAWRQFAITNELGPEITLGIGVNYVELCRTASDSSPVGLSPPLLSGLEAVLAGSSPRFESEFTTTALPASQWFLVTATRMGSGRVVVSSRNITEQKIEEERRAYLEVERNRAARSRSMGRLAGGVAHNLNNMLGVILGHTDLALHSAEPDDPLRAELFHIRDASERAARLIRQLLTFAGGQRVEPRRLNLGATVADMLPGLRRLVGDDISISLSATDDLWPVDVDPLQVELIVTNLCTNARDAIESVGGGPARPGTIAIEIGNAAVASDDRVVRGGPIAGDFVRLAVRDNGCGIPPEQLPDIFDPFFTTKETAPGMGLGLASVHGAVTQCGGGVAASSDGRDGATFEIFFPRHHPEQTTAAGDAAHPPTADQMQTILVVDDEPALLRAAARALVYEHYNVLTAASAEEALVVAREHSGPIHLLITDVLLPQMGGRELIDAIAASRPGLPHLFMSGYSSDIVTGAKGVQPDDHFIAKPFRIDDLATKVREILDMQR